MNNSAGPGCLNRVFSARSALMTRNSRRRHGIHHHRHNLYFFFAICATSSSLMSLPSILPAGPGSMSSGRNWSAPGAVVSENQEHAVGVRTGRAETPAYRFAVRQQIALEYGRPFTNTFNGALTFGRGIRMRSRYRPHSLYFAGEPPIPSQGQPALA